MSSLSRPLRVISLLPSATEQFASIVAMARTLGTPEAALPVLVGRSHECDFPPSFASVPKLTKARTTFTTCEEVHNEVLALLQTDNSLYEIDTTTLLELDADLILVQDVCKVCSIDKPSVACAVGSGDAATRILLVNSQTLANALADSVQLLGDALGLSNAARAVVKQNEARQAAIVASLPPSRKPPMVYIVEWLAPLFVVKGWAAEMVALAGGAVPSQGGKILDPSSLEPADVIVVALCGLDRDVAKKELQSKPLPAWWLSSPAVQSNNVFVVDGNQMFNRPTNRLLDALLWLTQLLPAPAAIETIATDFPYERYLHEVPTTSVSAVQAAIDAAHAAACAAREARYDDPATGYGVFTAWYLAERQVCCGNRCRHCPYGHVNVPIENLGDNANALEASVFLKAPKPLATGRLGYKRPPRGTTTEVVIVFWSGGKDSLLALSETIRGLQPGQELVLLTTFNPDGAVVPVQNIAPRTIVDQAKVLNIPLFLVAVPTGSSYAEVVKAALSELVPKYMPKAGRITGLVFGDLHLQDVKAWRSSTFAEYTLASPLWARDMRSDLLPALAAVCTAARARIAYSAVNPALLPGVAEGDAYDPAKVPDGVDVMGENGEFHTVVLFD
ncbi:ATP-binding Cassette (ABC) Superfamily [Achlya hypogyna]|uniref:Diphthine--ammonia ligase n=1 Tax=Achlya hypogyna TaxID=1202772 RepID=A0A1V9ZU27_ACHHY|nr:ATP-binding Cassette (ABC) Superfamily [Achlya hypogyna]